MTRQHDVALLSLAISLIQVVRALPQVAHGGEPVTAAATSQVPVTVTPVALQPVPVPATTTFDNGLYTWQASSFLLASSAPPVTLSRVVPSSLAAVASISSTDDDDETTTSSSSIQSLTTFSPTSTTPLSTSTPSDTASASIAAASQSASSSAAAAEPSMTASRIITPLLSIGAVILVVFLAGLWWTRRHRIRRWWAAKRRGRSQRGYGDRHDDDDDTIGSWAEKVGRGPYEDAGRRESVAWAEQHETDFSAIPYDRDDRYGSVSTRMAASHSFNTYDGPIEQSGEERGWQWGTAPLHVPRRSADGRSLPALPDEKELLADHDRFDAMLAASRTGYTPREGAGVEVGRRPSMLERAGRAVASSLSIGSDRSRRMATVSSYADRGGRTGSWDEHGAWRSLPEQDEYNEKAEERPLPPEPTTPNQVRAGAFQGDSVRRPLMAATPDTAVSRSVRRWQLTDRPVPEREETPSPTKRSVSQIPDILRAASPRPLEAASPPLSPSSYYASPRTPGVPMPPPMTNDASTMSLSHMAALIFPGATSANESDHDAFGPYTSLPTPTRQQRSASRRTRGESTTPASPGRTPSRVARAQIDDIVNDAISRRAASPSPSAAVSRYTPPSARRGAATPAGQSRMSRQALRGGDSDDEGSLTDLVTSLLASEDRS